MIEDAGARYQPRPCRSGPGAPTPWGASRRRKAGRDAGYPVAAKAPAAARQGFRSHRPPMTSKSLLVRGPRGGKVFSDSRVYVECYLADPGTSRFSCWPTAGHVLHLGERDCSIHAATKASRRRRLRRDEELLEEAASPPRRRASATSDGTVECSMSARTTSSSRNTRVQVALADRDGPASTSSAQVLIAAERRSRAPRKTVAARARDRVAGSARRHTRSSPGAGRQRLPRAGRPGVRVDSGVVRAPSHPEYDPIVAKLIVLTPDASSQRRSRARGE